MLIDTHIHLDLMENMQSLIRQIKDSNIGIIAVGTTPKAFFRDQTFASGVSNIKIGLGLHPQLVNERANEIDLFLAVVQESDYIGEIGLDFSDSYIASYDKQISCFHRIARTCAYEGRKILSIHSVKSAGTVVDELKTAGTFKTCTCIFHWFSGSEKDRKRAIEMGAYFSINPRMLNTKSGIETIKDVPSERILIETDAPFVKRFEKVCDLEKELLTVIHEISIIRGEDMLEQISQNSNRIWI